ncbi:MAG: TolC family protein, partial [Gemmatimonadota bacterium]
MRVDRGAGRTGRRVAALRVSRSLVVAGLCGVVGATAVAAQEAPSAEAAVVDGGGGTGLTEREAVALALERNRELVEARLGLEAAESQVREAWGAVYPHLSVSTTYMRNLTVPSSFLPAVFLDPEASPDELIPVQFGADNNWTLDLRLEQPIFEAQAFIGVGAADRYRRLQRESVRGMAEEIATRVRIAYHDVLLAGERVRLSELALERIRRTLEETRALREAGMASEYDVLRLEVQLANLEPDLRRARNGHAAAKRALTVELGMRPTDTLTVAGSLLDVEPGGPAAGAESLAFTGLPEPTSLPVERVVRMAVERRSDLRQLLLTENLRHAELRVAQTEYLPTVSLFGTYSINTQENDSPDFFGGSEAPRAYGRQIGIQVSVPIFSGFQRPA